LFSGLATLIFALSVTFAQAPPANDVVVPAGQPAFFGATPVDLTQVQVQSLSASLAGITLIMPPDGSDPNSIVSNGAGGGSIGPRMNNLNPHVANSGIISGLDTVPTFEGTFFAQAGPNSTGLKLFPFTMVGNHPYAGGATHIPADAVEVSLQLLNADGSTFKIVPFAPFETHTLNSPNFVNASYTSSPNPTQFSDAIQRAEFFPMLVPGAPWHTLLTPNVVDHVTIVVPRFVNVRLANGNIIQARSYFTGTAADGSTFVLMLNLLFNFFFDNLVVNEINNGNYPTDALNLTLFPNTFLFSLNVNNPNTPGGCCVLGFHTFFFSPGSIPQPRWLTAFASWISPGIFGGGFQDVTALSHEIAETLNDPFLDNATPKWQFPGQPANSKVCQANLETGDPLEVLANGTSPVTINGFTFHPQTEALVQWFEMGKTSNALGGAFSYPDTTALPHSAIPCPP